MVTLSLLLSHLRLLHSRRDPCSMDLFHPTLHTSQSRLHYSPGPPRLPIGRAAQSHSYHAECSH